MYSSGHNWNPVLHSNVISRCLSYPKDGLMDVLFLGHLPSSPKILKKKQCVHYSMIGIPTYSLTPATMVLSAQFCPIYLKGSQGAVIGIFLTTITIHN